MLLLGAVGGLPDSAWANPCDTVSLPDPLADLRRKVDRATDPDALTDLGRRAGVWAQKAPNRAIRACAHYVAGATAFYLSAGKTHQALHAAQAWGHLVAAAALAPEAMQARQPQARLRTVVARIGEVDGWSNDGSVAVTLPPRPGGGVLQLRPVSTRQWIATCGDHPRCADALNLRLPLPESEPTPIWLRAGRYLATVPGECGTAEGVVEVVDDPLADGGPLQLPAPSPCRVSLRPRDGDRAIDRFEVFTVGANRRRIEPDGLDARVGRVRIEVPGYKPVEIRPNSTDRVVDLPLERCPVDLRVRVVPGDARVSGAGLGAWGRREIRAERGGHQSVSKAVDVPAPIRCADAVHEVSLRLPRRVTMVTRNEDGETVTPGRLIVDGTIMPAAGVVLAIGAHRYVAEHPRYPRAHGSFMVEPCRGDPCPPATVTIDLPPRPPREWGTGPRVALGVGGALIAGGLLAGLAAVESQQRIDGYTRKRDEETAIDTLIEQRDRQARTADALVTTGAVTAVAAIVWHMLAGEDR